jgi:DnaJ homolog subfamily B member 4
MPDYYKILGVSRTATDEEIRKAYKKLSMKYHPDRPNGDEERFKQINEAYDVLKDPMKRLQYNQGEKPTGGNGDYEPNASSGQRFHYSSQGGMPQGFNFGRFKTTSNNFSGTFFDNNDFENLFNNDDDFNPFRRAKQQEQEHILRLSLEEMYMGCETKISYPKSVIVDDGDSYTIPETITLNIPSKCYVGKKLKVTIPDTVNPQSIIIIIQPKKHPHYKLRENAYHELSDLELDMKITLKDSLTGFRLRVPGVDSQEIVVEEDSVIDPRKPYLISGKGFVNREGKRGNLYIKFDIKYPKKLNQKQKNEIKKILG